ncbi:hypothetical protein GQX73_g8446 [Xylaria multiplex]|uniref:DUF7924 domain-containing protein n=1 Tax=Xylaria multiplex TaxID=323545 RepID=A0A7C8MMW3_9PEZI|nr:hypothetical protein GQX73_g8446 [Xylaria multiplex]
MVFSGLSDTNDNNARCVSNATLKAPGYNGTRRCKGQLSQSKQPSYTRPTASSSARTRASKSTSSLYSGVAATDPEHTAWLWETVTSPFDHTASSRGKRTGASSATTSVASASSDDSRQEPAAKFTDDDFAESVLEAHGIAIRENGVNQDLQKSFNILNLPSEPKERLDIYKKLFALDVWLEPDILRVRREYKSMQVYRSNEAEYAAYALCNIFRDEPLYPWLPQEEGDTCWLPVRMLQVVCKPQTKWHAPPLVNPLKKRYEWDISPDCAYYVSLQAFDPNLRPNIHRHTLVLQKRTFCPYLTIEFKKDEDSLAVARHQVAVASTIALYNRYRLKREALEMSGDEWSEQHRSQLRHYSITFTASSWILWCTMPKTFPNWTGCNMFDIFSGDCCILPSAQKLVSVINDIHYWGLEIHGKSCKADIYAKIRSDPDADLNDISILEDDSK